MTEKTNHFAGASIYQINPRTFSREGTINAVTEELPKLRDLGFKFMYLCPVFREDDSTDRSFWSTRQKASNTDNPKNPYRMNDYFEIDEEYGTMEDLKRFVAESHKLGMKVILDLVYLHIGPNAEILKTHPEFAARNEDGSVKLTKWNFPYLNFKSEGLREYLYCNMVYYVGVIDADGFRCDVGDAVPIDFWQEGRRRICAIKPDAVMLNEGKKPGHFAAFDANYGFDWHHNIFKFLNGEFTAADIIENHQSFASQTPEGKLWLRDIENHDLVTDWPYRIEGHYGHDAIEAILALNYTVDGVPMVYCGNEIADTANLSMFANRFHMGAFSVTDRNACGAHVERRKAVITALNGIKESIAALNEGTTKWHLTEYASILAFERVTEEETVSFIGNYSNNAAELNIGELKELILSNNAEICADTVKLGNFGYIIYRGNIKK